MKKIFVRTHTHTDTHIVDEMVTKRMYFIVDEMVTKRTILLLSDQDLKDLGFPMGHRRLILKWIASNSGDAAQPTFVLPSPSSSTRVPQQLSTPVSCNDERQGKFRVS